MARQPQPRWYASRDGWYAWIRGRQVRLAAGKAAKGEAWKVFHRMMLEDPDRDSAKLDLTFEVLCDMLIGEMIGKKAELTVVWYRRHLQSAVDRFGKVRASELRPHHVHSWLAGKEWGQSTRHGAITAVKRVYSWALRNKYLGENPLEALEKPGILRKSAIPTGEQLAAVLSSVDRHFRDLLVVLHETGMRPSEAYSLTSDNLDVSRSIAVFERHKTSGKTGRPRVVQLTPVALELLSGLAARRPDGPLLRNRAGKPWNRHVVAHRFARLRDRLKLGGAASAGSIRHLFVTDALDAGVPLATVAELAGHRSTAMLERHYSHLSERGKHLREAVSRIRGDAARVPADEPDTRS